MTIKYISINKTIKYDDDDVEIEMEEIIFTFRANTTIVFKADLTYSYALKKHIIKCFNEYLTNNKTEIKFNTSQSNDIIKINDYAIDFQIRNNYSSSIEFMMQHEINKTEIEDIKQNMIEVKRILLKSLKATDITKLN